MRDEGSMAVTSPRRIASWQAHEPTPWRRRRGALWAQELPLSLRRLAGWFSDKQLALSNLTLRVLVTQHQRASP